MTFDGNNLFLTIAESIVNFINAPYEVMEGGGAYNVCLSITPACDRPAEVDLVTQPKDALRKLLLHLTQFYCLVSHRPFS